VTLIKIFQIIHERFHGQKRSKCIWLLLGISSNTALTKNFQPSLSFKGLPQDFRTIKSTARELEITTEWIYGKSLNSPWKGSFASGHWRYRYCIIHINILICCSIANTSPCPYGAWLFFPPQVIRVREDQIHHDNSVPSWTATPHPDIAQGQSGTACLILQKSS